MTVQNLNERMQESINSAKIEAAKKLSMNAPSVSIFTVSIALIMEFIKCFYISLGFVKGTRGLEEAIYQALDKAIVLTYLWEFQNKDRNNNK